MHGSFSEAEFNLRYFKFQFACPVFTPGQALGGGDFDGGALHLVASGYALRSSPDRSPVKIPPTLGLPLYFQFR